MQGKAVSSVMPKLIALSKLGFRKEMKYYQISILMFCQYIDVKQTDHSSILISPMVWAHVLKLLVAIQKG